MREFQGNWIGWLYEQTEELPDAFWTHLITFLAGFVAALVLLCLVTLA